MDAKREQLALAAAGKIIEKEYVRDAVGNDVSEKIDLKLSATIGDETVLNRSFAAEINVGGAGKGASSKDPNTVHLVAVLLGKFNKATREKILRELPEQFARNDNKLPAVDDVDKAWAEQMLKRLRVKQSFPVRGAVRVSYKEQ